jgi:hypothetical protein
MGTRNESGLAARDLGVADDVASGLAFQRCECPVDTPLGVRRKEAVEALENLAAVASHLKHLLLIRDLRKLAR